MKKASILILMSIIAILSSCENTIEPLSNEANKLVNEFVYDGMSLYYFWESEMTGKKPGTQNSMQYFDGLLNSTDKQHGWSFITDDAKALQAQFGGNPVDFGYELAFGYVDSTKTSVFAVVEFVYPNSPAANAGLQRCDVITKIGGTTLNLSNYMLLLGNDAITITYHKSDPSQNFTASLAPATIETNPVLYTNIYEYNGHKIGYIFYTSFIANFNTALYQKFSEFKQAGITDLVVDLRYNRGGSISAAVYLASLIAPRNVVENQSVYTSLNFNDYLNNYYGSKRSYQLGTYETRFQNPLTANLNLNKVYIIATEGSYSASELTAFCLDSYMDVVHIGEKTGGKYTASYSLHAYDEDLGITVWKTSSVKKREKTILQNWLIQPIVAIYTNKDNQDFSATDGLLPDYSFNKGEGYGHISNWKPIGDTSDIFLGQALWLITGNDDFKPTEPQSVKGLKPRPIERIALPTSLKSWDNSLILDLKPEELR